MYNRVGCMPTLNRCCFIGRLGADPQMMEIQGKLVCNFSIAINEKINNIERTTWINIAAWSNFAELTYNNLKKGRLVYVEGPLRIKEREVQGQKKTSIGVILTNIQFLDAKT